MTVAPVGRRALIIGFGRSGQAAARYLQARGLEVGVVDRADTSALRSALDAFGIHGRLGGYAEEDLEGVDLVVVSPGVPWDLALAEEARRRGIRVTSEIELFFDACPSPIIGITGTNGKTTTTALAADVMRAGGQRVMRGGNIGEPVLDRVSTLDGGEWVVLELSSFQLESIARPHLRIGTVLNVTPDHLDRHGTFETYRDLKAKAIRFLEPGDDAILNRDDASAWAMRAETRARLRPFSTKETRLVDGVVVVEGWVRAGTQRVLPAAEVPLPGAHNLSNTLAAIGIGWAAGVAADAMAAAVRHFKGLEHRLEFVVEANGVRWYNDSKATTPESTIRALEAFEAPIVLIAGGRNKGVALEPLSDVIAKRAAAFIAIGETGRELVDRVRAAGLKAACLEPTLEEAVHQARGIARPGSIVLLSPAFTSYDMFRDFEDRGHRFKDAVARELQS